ncbi:Uncharacterised protein [Streptococcus pneumoniae]|nr:Uncharacterised protein [Streptococcus pneumoniae]
MVIKTDLRGRVGTLTKREYPIQQPLDFIGCPHIGIRSKIKTSVLFDLTSDNQAWIALIGDFDERIGLIILEHDIVLGLVFLDQVDF